MTREELLAQLARMPTAPSEAAVFLERLLNEAEDELERPHSGVQAWKGAAARRLLERLEQHATAVGHGTALRNQVLEVMAQGPQALTDTLRQREAAKARLAVSEARHRCVELRSNCLNLLEQIFRSQAR